MLDWIFDSLFAPVAGHRQRNPEAVWVEPEYADAFGLVGVGGDLHPDRLLAAYRQGVFPMYEEGEPICWWSPDPRAVFDLDRYHVSRRLARTLRGGGFAVTFDRAFPAVMLGCADRAEGTWITPEMLDGYIALHRRGVAHSAEVWRDGVLVGGVYGVGIGGAFAGESMFGRVRDASKVALVHLFERLRERGYVLFDTQILNDHTASLGAYEIPRAVYLDRLRAAVDLPIAFDDGEETTEHTEYAE